MAPFFLMRGTQGKNSLASFVHNVWWVTKNGAAMAKKRETRGSRDRRREKEKERGGGEERSLLFKGVDAPHLNVTHKPCILSSRVRVHKTPRYRNECITVKGKKKLLIKEKC